MPLKQIIEIKNSCIHGKGIFAKTSINSGTIIGHFEGSITHEDSKYVLWMCDENDKWYGIKGTNELRFLNHDSIPNSEFDDNADLIALTDIRSGEELTIDYGENWE